MRYNNTGKEKENGVVYTPEEMAKYLATEMCRYYEGDLQNEINILDPAVGQGELLIAMVNAVSQKQNFKKIAVVGYETDSQVAKKTQSKLEDLFPDMSIKIRNEDFLGAVENGNVERYQFVIANPPYVRTQILGSSRAQNISEKLSLSGRIDIYYAFLVYTKSVLTDDGVAGYITSNKFLTIKSGNNVRDFMLENYRLHRITDLGDTKLFSAAVLPCIVIFSIGQTSENDVVEFSSVYESADNDAVPIKGIFEAIHESGCYQIPDGRKFNIKQGVLHHTEKGELWNIRSDDISEWLQKVESNTWLYFRDIGKIRVGIKTTADNVFIGNDWSGENADLELLRPLITHRNAGQIIPNDKDHWQVLYTNTTRNGKRVAYDIDRYPKSKKYLLSHYDQLASRSYIKKANRNWYEIWVPQNPDSWKDKKIVFRDISEHPQFWIDETGAIVNGDCYWIDINNDVMDDTLYLALAIANSSFIEKYYDCKFNTKLYSGKRRYMSQYVEQFPIPFYGTPLAQKAIALVKKIIAESNRDSVSSDYRELNNIVEQLFA